MLCLSSHLLLFLRQSAHGSPFTRELQDWGNFLLLTSVGLYLPAMLSWVSTCKSTPLLASKTASPSHAALCPQHGPEDASCPSQSCSAGQSHASLLLVWLKASRLTAVQMVPSGSHEIDEQCYPIKEGLAGCTPSPLCSLGK